ncbi:MAG: glutamate 5-kinase [Pseudomonadota bacterium]
MTSVTAKEQLSAAESVVIKVGSSLLTHDHALRTPWLASLAADIGALIAAGKRVTVVSSGAVALGRTASDFVDSSDALSEKQARAAIGQIQLAEGWRLALSTHSIPAAQILLTPDDTEDRQRYLNARDTLDALASVGAVAIINENDTVATEELRYGDNDRLAARVASMIGADLLILLSDVDGIYDTDPSLDANAEHIPLVRSIDEPLWASAGDSRSAVGTGGMRSKLMAASIAVTNGIPVVLSSGHNDPPISSILKGGRCTVFLSEASRRSARRQWIAASLRREGKLILDRGAADAVRARKSLLPIGVTSIEGDFSRGDCVTLMLDNQEIGVGVVRVDASAARSMLADAKAGARTGVLVHSDDLVPNAKELT